MPRVTIITAAYNHKSYIAQAIESVLGQTYTDWEHIIWDDGSSDGTLEIAQGYAARDPRIRVFTHPGNGNRGQENTRNSAVEKANGSLLCLLDSDDFYLPRKLELLVPCFDRDAVGLAYGSYDCLLEGMGGRRVPSGLKHEPEGRVFEVLARENFVGAGAVLFRRECLNAGFGFDPTLKTTGEYPLWLRIARDWEFAHVPEVVAVWRDHGDNLGTQLALHAKKELVEFFERLAWNPEYARHADVLFEVLAQRTYVYAAELYAALDLEAARETSLKVLSMSSAPLALKSKAATLASLTLLGAKANDRIRHLKRFVWELRHPTSRLLRKSRDSKSKL